MEQGEVSAPLDGTSNKGNHTRRRHLPSIQTVVEQDFRRGAPMPKRRLHIKTRLSKILHGLKIKEKSNRSNTLVHLFDKGIFIDSKCSIKRIQSMMDNIY